MGDAPSRHAAGSKPGVIFDVDGTLLDTNYLHALAWWQAMRDAGVSGVSMWRAHQAIGIASDGLVRHLLGEIGQSRTAEISDAHTRRYDELQDQVVAFDGAAGLLQRCADSGLTVVLATSGRQEDLAWMLPAIGVDEGLLAGATTSADVEEAKPAPDLLAVAVEQHGLDPQRAVAIGDTVWDVRSAHDADLPIIAFTCGGIARCQLEAAGADEVYDDPADLLRSFGSSLLARLS